MKSSSGQYFIGLDHIRGMAAFIVFTWHFLHMAVGHSGLPPVFPLSILAEGHTGVSLFMALSGYLFAKLLDNKRIIYSKFIWNRCLRLLPLLIIVVTLVGIEQYFLGRDMLAYMKKVVEGAVMWTLPNGGWSITVEFHFYAVLPVLLFLTKKSKYSMLGVLMCVLMARTALYLRNGQVQGLSYLTIIGHIDQFILGIMAFQLRKYIAHKHALFVAIFVSFAAFYSYFDNIGGYHGNPSFPSPNPIWIYLPTIEGLAYASLIAWYDNSFQHSSGKASKFFAAIGTYSYSIYLLHFFVVFKMAKLINSYLVDLSNVYMALILAVPCFLLMVPIGYLSYRFIELPFLKFRTKYTV